MSLNTPDFTQSGTVNSERGTWQGHSTAPILRFINLLPLNFFVLWPFVFSLLLCEIVGNRSNISQKNSSGTIFAFLLNFLVLRLKMFYRKINERTFNFLGKKWTPVDHEMSRLYAGYNYILSISEEPTPNKKLFHIAQLEVVKQTSL